jgi:hypothetical protein
MGKRDIDAVVEQAPGIAEKLAKVSRARSATSKTPDSIEAAILSLILLVTRSGRPESIREVSCFSPPAGGPRITPGETPAPFP